MSEQSKNLHTLERNQPHSTSYKEVTYPNQLQWVLPPFFCFTVACLSVVCCSVQTTRFSQNFLIYFLWGVNTVTTLFPQLCKLNHCKSRMSLTTFCLLFNFVSVILIFPVGFSCGCCADVSQTNADNWWRNQWVFAGPFEGSPCPVANSSIHLSSSASHLVDVHLLWLYSAHSISVGNWAFKP